MRCEFYSPTRILFGAGSIAALPVEMGSFGQNVLLVSGRTGDRTQIVTTLLCTGNFTITPFQISGEPTTDIITQGVNIAKSNHCSVVISIGGGSVIDTGKAIAALINNPGGIHRYLEVIGDGTPLHYPSIPQIAIPTTAGTGAEVTKNAVLLSPEHRVKVSLRSTSMYPTLAIVDPELLRTLPPDLMASTGLDALTQCIEAYVSNKATFFTDALSRDGITRALRSLAHACNGESSAYSDMSYASLVSGIALANSGLGAVHGFAAAIGGMCNLPHGTVCAHLLPAVIEANIKRLSECSPTSPALAKYEDLAGMLCSVHSGTPSDIPGLLNKLYSTLPLRKLSPTSVNRQLYPEMVTAARSASSMKGNPVHLTDNDLYAILEKAFS